MVLSNCLVPGVSYSFGVGGCGQAIVLGNCQRRCIFLIRIKVGQELTVLVVGADGCCLNIFLSP